MLTISDQNVQRRHAFTSDDTIHLSKCGVILRSISVSMQQGGEYFWSNVRILLINETSWFISNINRLHCVVHWHSWTKPTAGTAWILSMWNTLSYCAEKLVILSLQILINSSDSLISAADGQMCDLFWEPDWIGLTLVVPSSVAFRFSW